MSFLYERFMEKRMQKTNNSEQPVSQVSLPFPIAPLRTAFSTVLRKRTSKTSKIQESTFSKLSPQECREFRSARILRSQISCHQHHGQTLFQICRANLWLEFIVLQKAVGYLGTRNLNTIKLTLTILSPNQCFAPTPVKTINSYPLPFVIPFLFGFTTSLLYHGVYWFSTEFSFLPYSRSIFPSVTRFIAIAFGNCRREGMLRTKIHPSSPKSTGATLTSWYASVLLHFLLQLVERISKRRLANRSTLALWPLQLFMSLFFYAFWCFARRFFFLSIHLISGAYLWLHCS